MLRLFGLFVCVSLAFVFPLYAYEINSTVVSDAIISTSVFVVIIIALFPESNFNKKIQKKNPILNPQKSLTTDNSKN